MSPGRVFYSDHPFSFVDGTSFALMRQQRIRFAFAFDTHFATAGFVRIPMDFTLASRAPRTDRPVTPPAIRDPQDGTLVNGGAT